MVVGETQLAATRPTVPRGRRAYALTAPPNLNGKKGSTLKRDAPTVWESVSYTHLTLPTKA